DGAALYYAVSTDGGKSFSKNKKVIDYSCQCCRVVMAIDNDQLPVIVWRHIFGDNIRDHALVKFDNQTQAGKVQRVSYDNWQVDACPHHGPDISISKNGSYHLAWFNNAPQRHGLFYARTDDQGKSFSEPLSFGNYNAQAAHPQVLSKGDNIFLAWKEFDGKQSILFMMRSSDAGKSWSTPHIIAKTAGGSDHPLLIADNKNVYSVWHRLGQDYQLFPLEGY
ncbi:MAG: glycoside hydrolase, partial [Gammaproteobacteria bacterium]|nr:glycoside hydrolase [Gammaproteobacteria bacterium]